MHYFLCLCFEIWYCCVDYPRCSLSQTKMFKGCSRCQCLDYKLHTKSNRVYMGLLLLILLWWCALVVGGVHIYILTLKWDYLILLLIHLAFKFFIISNAIALIILSMVKSIADIILPNIDVFLFSVINGIYTVLAIGNWHSIVYW